MSTTGIAAYGVMHAQFLLNITKADVTTQKASAIILYAQYVVHMSNGIDFDIGMLIHFIILLPFIFCICYFLHQPK